MSSENPRQVLQVGELVPSKVGLGDGVEERDLVELGQPVYDRTVTDCSRHKNACGSVDVRIDPAASKVGRAGLGLFEPVGPDRSVLSKPQVDVERHGRVAIATESVMEAIAHAVTCIERTEAVDGIEKVFVAC